MSRTADVLSFLAATRGQYVPVRSSRSLRPTVAAKMITHQPNPLIKKRDKLRTGVNIRNVYKLFC